jgi:D-xylulose reductase
VPSRLAFAKSYAATDAWAPIAKHDGEGATAYAARNAQAMKTELGLGDGVDLSLDASGAPASIQTGLLLVKPGGVHVQVGMGHPDLAIPVVSVLAREVTIRGSFRYGVRASFAHVAGTG